MSAARRGMFTIPISMENRSVRVIPDLFADFLVFDTAFDTRHRLPELARVVLKEFGSETAAVLRNLAEATWVAGSQAIGRDELLRPLLDADFARFDSSNFFERGRMIEQWATFSVYLPAESLALAKKALTQTTAPGGTNPDFQLGLNDDGINSHRYENAEIQSDSFAIREMAPSTLPHHLAPTAFRCAVAVLVPLYVPTASGCIKSVQCFRSRSCPRSGFAYFEFSRASRNTDNYCGVVISGFLRFALQRE